jgi:hypothetical protein
MQEITISRGTDSDRSFPAEGGMPTSSSNAPPGTSSAAAASVESKITHEEGGYKAALGSTWHHCVTVRLTMHMEANYAANTSPDDDDGDDDNEDEKEKSNNNNEEEEERHDGSGNGQRRRTDTTMSQSSPKRRKKWDYELKRRLRGQSVKILRLTKSSMVSNFEMPYYVGNAGICEYNVEEPDPRRNVEESAIDLEYDEI